MTLGASALGQVALAGGGYEAAVGVNYVDLSGNITITSSVLAAISIAGQVTISATFTMQSAITCSLTAAITFPDAGVGFTISDKAGGA